MVSQRMWARGVRAGLGAIVAVALGVSAAPAQDRGSSVSRAMEAERRIDRWLTEDRDFGVVYIGLRKVFPEEYRVLLAQLARETEGDDPDADTAFADLASVLEKYEAAAVLAPNAELATVAERRHAALRSAQSNPALCMAIANGDLAAMSKARGASRRAIGEMMVAAFRAMKAGHDQPTERDPLSEEDLTALEEAMRRNGVSQRVIDQAMGDREPANTREACAAETALFRALETMPGRRVAAFMAALYERGADGAEPTAAELAAELLSETVFAPLFAVLKAEFPAEFEDMAKRFVSALEREEEDAVSIPFDTVYDIARSHWRDVSNAPDVELSALIAARGGALRQLNAQDPEFCAAFADSFYYETPEGVSDAVSGALARYEAAYLKAVAAGVKAPVKRAAPGDRDFDLLAQRVKELRRSDEALESLFSGEQESMSARQRCDFALVLNEALAAMPSPSGGVLRSELVSILAEPVD